MKHPTSETCLNCHCKLKGNIVEACEQASNCRKCGVFISKDGVFTYKEDQGNSESPMAPLEHYHTILIDEIYQHHEFIVDETPYSYMRRKLIDMLFETKKKLRQTESTVFLAIKYLDIILNTKNFISYTVPAEAYKLLAIVCFTMASKFDALDLNTPLIDELQRASGCRISYDSLLEYESECLKLLNWELKQVTLFHCVDILKHQGIIFNNDTRCGGASIEDDLMQTVSKAPILLDYFADMLVRDCEFLKFKPSIQASACVFATRMCLNIDIPQSDSLSEMLLYTQQDVADAFELLDKKFGYLIHAARSTLSLTESSNNGSRVDISSAHVNTSKQQQNIAKIMRDLLSLHDFNDRVVIEKRMCTSVYSSNDSAKYSDEDLQLTSESEDGGYFYYENSGLKVPYNLDEMDLDMIEQSLQQQMEYCHLPLTQIRSASTASDLRNYKDKISSLLGDKTKGSTSGKENYEDMNNDESPLFDAELEKYYNPDSLKYLLHSKQQLASFMQMASEEDLIHEVNVLETEEDKLQRKREQKKVKKQRRKAKKQAMKQQVIELDDSDIMNAELLSVGI